MEDKLSLKTFLNLPNCFWQTYSEIYLLGSYYLVDYSNNMYGMVRYSKIEDNYIPFYLADKKSKIFKSYYSHGKYLSLNKEENFELARFNVELKIAQIYFPYNKT